MPNRSRRGAGSARATTASRPARRGRRRRPRPEPAPCSRPARQRCSRGRARRRAPASRPAGPGTRRGAGRDRRCRSGQQGVPWGSAGDPTRLPSPLMRGPVACTIVATRGLARARAVGAAFLEHNAAWRFVVVVSDAVEELEKETDVVAATALFADRGAEGALELSQMAMMYDETGLNAALKPYALRHLLDVGASIALYVAPDIHVLG